MKSWIKVESEDLTGKISTLDTTYTRYTFSRSEAYISLNPAWDDYNMKCDLQGNQIQIGYQIYNIEELTDTTFSIHAPGFRKIKFKSEKYLCQNPIVLRKIGEKNSIPVYQASDTLTPRYIKGKLDLLLEKNSHGYNIVQATYFRMDFTITEKGKVEDVVVTKSISYGFDKGMVEEIINTSGKWKPAYFNEMPVKTRMFFERKYWNSSRLGNTGK